ncbi:YHS domain-containing (seleno)protein [Flavobacterium soyangense]|uniref:YHS domain protein n=1 Tax=Flavobacterium soyangense TaxID=2023265 RepID=A0A930U7Z6_9FLAO|nr:YHS domain-containing (seleno)protein [Flavobacterium soyangense]MBF2708426.1 YHS domain protein [Flavobacterium soyangense]
MKKKILLLALTFITMSINAQTVAKITTEYNLDNKVAIQGYDPVAYFVNNKAALGSKDITTELDGVIYYFSNEGNKKLFLNNPTQYQPQFGGYCAYGISEGHKAPITPEAFTIVDNKLYLNYNLEVKEIWLKNQKEHIAKAIENWSKITDTK